MDLYTKTCYEISRHLTLEYSTSFSKSTKLFPRDIQPHIFAIYGLVRVADEVVDTCTGKSRQELLDSLKVETYTALKTAYSTNPLVHSFAQTARQYNITKTLIAPFFESMRMDLEPKTYTQKLYETYIYGSAEVIGLMCLKVFTRGNEAEYNRLEADARALGSAYQKVNFLRDFASDYQDRQRVYFPKIRFDTFDETQKNAIIQDIQRDFTQAKRGVLALPADVRKAVGLSYLYYHALLKKLEVTPADTIKTSRIRVSDSKKFWLLLRSKWPEYGKGNVWQK